MLVLTVIVTTTDMTIIINAINSIVVRDHIENKANIAF